MKKSKKIFSIVLIMSLILLMFLAGYTFARYYKNVQAGTASAGIARWSFGSGNTQETIYLGGEEKIAPGSSGDFTIEIDATNSEVPVDYEVSFLNEKNIPRNMKFIATIKDEKGVELYKTSESNSLDELSNSLVGNIPYEVGNQKRTILVNWDWDFNEDETTIDSEDGTLLVDENGNPLLDGDNDTSLDCKFDIEIIGRQAQ